MRVIDCAQRTDAWWEARRGMPTASQYKRIVKSDGKRSDQRKAYLYECAAVRITGVYEDTYTSAAIQRGIEMEEEARLVYQMDQEVTVAEVGFCLADGERWGASPDGLIGDDGLLEIKCPSGKTQVEYLLRGKLPAAYFQQVHGQLQATGRAWCDFVSYYPGLPMLVVRVELDREFLAKLEAELVAFCDELDEICKDIGGA